MPKLKTRKAVKKRFRLTKTGKVKRAKAGKKHLLAKKSSKRKRSLLQPTMVDKTFQMQIRKCLPYG